MGMNIGTKQNWEIFYVKLTLEFLANLHAFFSDVEENTVYNVSLCSFLATQMYRRKSNLHRFVRDRQIGIPDHQCLKEYIEERGTISPKVEVISNVGFLVQIATKL